MARRRRLASALKYAAPVWIVGSLPIAAAGLLHFLEFQSLGIVFLALAGASLLLFSIVHVGLGLVHHHDDAEQGAAYVDRTKNLQDTLKSALEPSPHLSAGDRREHQFRNLLEERARATAAGLEPTEIAPITVSPSYLIGTLILVSAAFFMLRADGVNLPGMTPFTVASAQSRPMDETGSESVPMEDTAEEEQAALLLTAEQLAQLGLRRGERPDLDKGQFDLGELESMSKEELSQLLKELGANSALNSEAANAQERLGDSSGSTDDPKDPANDAQNSDGLQELQRQTGEDPFASPSGDQRPVEQGEQEPGSSMSPSEASDSSDQVQRIELPPMANPNARPTENGAPSSAAAMASTENSKELATAEDASQSGAGGGESSGPQGSEQSPLGDISEIAVTLELAILQAEEEQDRPVERSIRHRASAAQESKVQRRGISSANQAANDQALAAPVLSQRQAQRVQRYFAPKQWPQAPPS